MAALSAGGAGRGGARNRADRESDALTAAQIANLTAAERHAKKLGLPFTRMISIHWEAAGVPLAGMAKATGRFTDLMAKALAGMAATRHGSGRMRIAVPKGGHCHLLAHVPADLVPGSHGAATRLASPDHRAALPGARDPQQARLAGGWAWRQAIPISTPSIWRRRLPMS